MEVWFNPSCSKCRTATASLDEAGVAYTVRRYLEVPPTEDDLRAVLAALRMDPWDITRMDEPLARELGLPGLARDADAWVRVLAGHPSLIQRPIVLTGDGRAWVARDGDTLAEVLATARGGPLTCDAQGMDAASLRALQAPLKQQYRDDPATAITPMQATAEFSDPGITTTVQTWSGPARAGLHPAAGGDGADACSGDMLLQALLGCAGVTLRSVATAMGVTIREARLRADAVIDARGTLGVSREAPVGLQDVTVSVELDTDADDDALATLARLTERYCVVAQSLATTPRFTLRRVGLT